MARKARPCKAISYFEGFLVSAGSLNGFRLQGLGFRVVGFRV